jgi:hypothetical protein
MDVVRDRGVAFATRRWQYAEDVAAFLARTAEHVIGALVAASAFEVVVAAAATMVAETEMAAAAVAAVTRSEAMGRETHPRTQLL